MRNLKRYASIAVISCALFATSPLYAEGERWYAGLGLGFASYSEDQTNAICAQTSLVCQLNEVDLAFKIMGGRQFNRNFALEFGFDGWGEASVDEMGLGTDILLFSGSGVHLTAIPELPLTKNFSIFGALGFAFMDTKIKVADVGPLAVSLDSGASEDAWALVYGLGIAGNVKRWTFRLQWEQIDPDVDFDLGVIKIAAPKLDVYGRSVIVRF